MDADGEEAGLIRYTLLSECTVTTAAAIAYSIMTYVEVASSLCSKTVRFRRPQENLHTLYIAYIGRTIEASHAACKYEFLLMNFSTSPQLRCLFNFHKYIPGAVQ